MNPGAKIGYRISNICFEVGDIYRLDFPDSSCDALFSHNVLEHVADPDKALRKMSRMLKPGGIIGIRDADYGGYLLAPDDGFWDKFLTIWEAEYIKSGGGNPRIGRHLGTLFHNAGFKDIRMTASYEVYSDTESRRFVAEIVHNRLSEIDFVNRVKRYGLATVDELEAIKKAWLTWQELPGAIWAHSHCEAIGWKE